MTPSKPCTTEVNQNKSDKKYSLFRFLYYSFQIDSKMCMVCQRIMKNNSIAAPPSDIHLQKQHE